MNLSTNLQNLRKQANMSQEELAEKLNVSRQAISKWETGETIPETEKIITLCEIFNCSMDYLVLGEVKTTKVPNIKEKYDKIMNKFSKGIAIGVFLLLVGVTIFLTIIGSIPSPELEKRYILIGVSILLVFVIISVPIFIILGIDLENFKQKNYNLDNIYTEEEKDEFNKKFSKVIASSVSVILVGVIVLILLYGLEVFKENSILPVAIFMIFICISVPFLVNIGIKKDKYDMSSIKAYRINKENEETIGKISGVIMIIMTIIYFILGFIFNLWQYNWLVYPIGGMLCGIVSVILVKEPK